MCLESKYPSNANFVGHCVHPMTLLMLSFLSLMKVISWSVWSTKLQFDGGFGGFAPILKKD